VIYTFGKSGVLAAHALKWWWMNETGFCPCWTPECW
jgi:hypothetical protein